MLSEISIRDFAIITEQTIKFGSGFNVLTGETGAGKSIILDAMGLILGGRADTAFIRAGAERTSVEGVFLMDPKVADAIEPILVENDLDDPDRPRELTVYRELRSNGRNVCRINGASVKVSLLREIGELLVGVHGQGDHLRLLNPKAHLPLLDAYAGIEEARKSFAEDVHKLRMWIEERETLQKNADLRQQRLEMLKFQIDEIDAADLKIGEEEELKAERTRLSNIEQLSFNATLAAGLISGDDEAEVSGAIDLISQAEAAISVLARLDETQADLLTRIQGLVSELTDLSGEVRTYIESQEHDPARLQFIEERIDLINRLKRKYGDEIQAVLAVRDEGLKELDTLENSDERLEELATLIEKESRQLGIVAEKLSKARIAAGKKLAKAIEAELGDLRMQAEFHTDVRQVPAADGLYVGESRFAYDYTGIDKVEFMLSANPGEPPKPMAKVASGGETARIMLALKTALASVDETPTLIFDEIDQGIGGRIGSVVGNKLWNLSGKAGHQVIVVTHLPQMAGYGDVHFQVKKAVESGRTVTLVSELEYQDRLSELGAMLGTKEDLAIVGARSILQEAREVKESVRQAESA